MGQVIDKGRIVAAVDKFQSKDKATGQLLLNNDNTPKMQNKWMAIGEATKWSNDDGSESVTTKIYLQPVNTSGNFYEQKTFWDSESTNNTQQAAPQQQAPQQYVQNGQAMSPQQVQQRNSGYPQG